ncbi:MAG: hypothetical protein E6J64_00075 [Deltaproteobacteria bacterium]|nr:MAG: hypothetical protein E6J64_00075 [Deltaproteobacteria bacterium]
MRYRDRGEAGRVLGERLAGSARQPDLLVLGPPRGGAPVAWEAARRLGALLDVFAQGSGGSRFGPRDVSRKSIRRGSMR